MDQKQVICMVFDSLLRYAYLLNSLHNAAYPEFSEDDIKGLPEPECWRNVSYNIVSCLSSYH